LMLAQMGSAFAIDFDSAAVLGNVQNTTATSLATALESILGKKPRDFQSYTRDYRHALQ